MVIVTEATPTHGAFYFKGSGLSLSVSGSWSGSMCRAHFALQELPEVAMMLCRMAFHFSGKVVTLHLDNRIAKAYLHNEGGIVSPFLSRLACQILSLTHKHSFTLIPANIPTHLNVEADYLSQGWLLLEWHLFLRCVKQLFTFGVYQRWICWHPPYHLMPVLLHLGNTITSGTLGLNAFNHPWTFQVSYLCPPSALFPLVLSKFLAEHVKG